MELHLTSGIGGYTLPRYPNTLLPESLSSMELLYLRWILWVVLLSTINRCHLKVVSCSLDYQPTRELASV